MGRYNFNIVKNDIGAWYHLDKAQMGLIATFGFWTYGLSVMLNGPLADRIGGRKAILIGSLGAGLLNLGVGLMFFNGWTAHVLWSMSWLWSLNMYFQSFGALSVVKVNSTWFHVRERGIFGGIFGIMISSGYFLATTIGSVLLASFANWNVIWFVPAAAMGTMFLVDLLLVRNRPSHAGHADFDTGDGSNAHLAEDAPLPVKELLAKVFRNPVDPLPDRRRVLHRLRAPGRHALLHRVPGRGLPPGQEGAALLVDRGGLHAGRHLRRPAVRLDERQAVPVAAPARGLRLLPGAGGHAGRCWDSAWGAAPGSARSGRSCCWA
ncbi:MAG: MFS transporter [Rhodopseudomonas palustris]|nr:MFS transporter [Rhodopseudomonas palustris]